MLFQNEYQLQGSEVELGDVEHLVQKQWLVWGGLQDEPLFEWECRMVSSDQYFHITSVGNRMWDSSEFEESNAEYFLSSKAGFNRSLVQILPPTYIISFAMGTKQPYLHDTILAGYSV